MADYPIPLTPCTPDEQENKVKAENDFIFISNKNNKFNVSFQNCTNHININSYSNYNQYNLKYEKRYNLNELKANKFLSICDSIDEIYEQLMIELRKKSNKTIIENNRNIIISIPVEHIKVKEIKFILEEKKIKTEKEQIKDLYEELIKVKNDNINIKEEINKIKNDMDFLKEENNKLKEKNSYFEEQLKLISDKLNNNNNNDKNKDKDILIPKRNDNKSLFTPTFPDIMDFNNGKIINEEKYNNIIYYNENISDLNSIYKDSDFFEKITLGAFIVCTNLNSLYLIREEILKEIKKDGRIKFNLILGEFNIKNFRNFINQNVEFSKCIQNTCIYTNNLDQYLNINIESLKIINIYNNREKVKHFINEFSSENIRRYPLRKLITYQDYLDKYKKFHYEIAKFYGDLSPETYKKYLEKIKILIEEEDKRKELKNRDKNKVYEGFFSFDLREDLNNVDKLIIREWTKDSYYLDLNKWLSNLDIHSFEAVAYFASRIMYSLNSYGKKEDKYVNINKKLLYGGEKISYSSLLAYERMKGNIITFSTLFETFDGVNIANQFFSRNKSKFLYKTKLLFSTKFILEIHHKNNFISNGINIENISFYKSERENLFQPFSFYFLRDVIIDINNYTADIYLETIGKLEILEEQIKKGKEIEYNENLKIMQVKK